MIETMYLAMMIESSVSRLSFNYINSPVPKIVSGTAGHVPMVYVPKALSIWVTT